MNSKLINQLIHIQYHECTNDKERFIASIKQLLDNTSLRKRTEQELWNLTWDKVYFAGVKTAYGRNWVNPIVAEGSLNDFNKIPEHPETPGLKRNPVRFRAVQQIADKFQHCFDIYEDVRKAISEMQEDIRSPESIDNIRRKLGVMPGSNGEGKLYNDLRVAGVNQGDIFEWGVSDATVLHMLTDYGFPVCKPDLWVVRWSDAFCTFSRNNNELEEYIQSSYPNFRVADCNHAYLKNPNNIHYNFLIIDYLIKKHFDETDPFFKEHDIDIEIQFNLYRFVDLILAKSGMSLEEGFGMNITPFNLLKDKNEPLRKKYDKFAEIVDIVRENGEKFGELELDTIDDFKRKIGSNANVQITCKTPIKGLIEIDGEILDVINENILIKTDSFGEVSISYNNIDKAKLKTKKTKNTQPYYDSSLNKAKKIFKINKVEDRYVVYCSKNENKTKYPIVREKKYFHEIIQTIWNTVIEKIRLVGSDITDQKKMEVIENVVLAFQDYDFFKSQENNRDIYPQAMERIKQQEITQEIMEIDNKFSNDERAYKIEEIFSKYNSDEIYIHIVY